MSVLHHSFQESAHIVVSLIAGEVEEMMAAQALENPDCFLSCILAGGFVRTFHQVADEFLLSIFVKKQIWDYNCETMPCMVKYSHWFFFEDAAFECDLPVMSVHLLFQILSWCVHGTQPRKIPSVCPEAEPVNAGMIRLAHEKEIPGVPDGWLGVHIVKIVLFRNFTERGAERLQVDLHFFADGIPGHGNEAGGYFPFPSILPVFRDHNHYVSHQT